MRFKSWHGSCWNTHTHARTHLCIDGYVCIDKLLSVSAVWLLVKIHLIIEHYRTEGIMIAALACNRNRSGQSRAKEREERGSRVRYITCALPIDSRDRPKFSAFLHKNKAEISKRKIICTYTHIQVTVIILSA